MKRAVTGTVRVLYDGTCMLLHHIRPEEDGFEILNESGELKAKVSVPKAPGDEMLAMYVCNLGEMDPCIRVTEKRDGTWREMLYCCGEHGWECIACTPEILMKFI